MFPGRWELRLEKDNLGCALGVWPADLDLRYLPAIDPVVERDPEASPGRPVASYLKTRSVTLLGAELCLMAVQAMPATKAASRGDILWVDSGSPRACALGKEYLSVTLPPEGAPFCSSCTVCVLGGPGLETDGCSKNGSCPQCE